jgi:hypothetical protein
MTEPAVRLPPTRIPPSSPAGAGRFAQAALFGYIGVEAVSVLTAGVTLLRWRERELELSSQNPFFADGWDFGLGLAFFGIWLICGIAWIIWQFQAHANLSSLMPTRFRPGAAFFILVPIASLFVPYQAMAELARAGIDRPPLRRWWWALYLTTNLLIGVASFLSYAGSWLAATVVGLCAGIVGIAAAAAAIRLIGLVGAGLESRRLSAGWAPSARQLSRRVAWVLAGSAAFLTLAGGAVFGLLLPAALANLTPALEPNQSFAVGSCFDETATEFVDVSCHEPHDAEVYYVVAHPETPSYPGDTSLEQWAEPQCYARFDSYTGIAYQDSSLEFGYLYPSALGWQSGDREVVCYLFDPSGEDLTRPIAQTTA